MNPDFVIYNNVIIPVFLDAFGNIAGFECIKCEGTSQFYHRNDKGHVHCYVCIVRGYGPFRPFTAQTAIARLALYGKQTPSLKPLNPHTHNHRVFVEAAADYFKPNTKESALVVIAECWKRQRPGYSDPEYKTLFS